MFIIGNRARCWKTMFTGRLFGGTSSIERPLIRMSPEVGSRKPATIRMIVVLPQPEGPSSVTSVPGAMSRSSGCSATTAPKCLVTLSKRTDPLVMGLS
ncbi:MAG: hypothetical protein R3D59_07545 [Paracoccaceae bacterium]